MNRFCYEAKNQKLKNAKIAAALNVHPETVRRWKRGDAPISSEYLPALAKMLGITIEQILAPFEIITK